MKRTCLLFSLVLFTACVHAQNIGYQFTVRIHGVSDTTVMLGHHYGDKQYVIDTVKIDHNGQAIFTGPTMLKGGLYLCVMPSLKNKYFEFIVSGREHDFILETDTSDFSGHMKVTGSLENKLFFEDLVYITAKRKEMNAIKDKMNGLDPASEEFIKLKEEMKTVNDGVEAERSAIVKKYPQLFYSVFLHALTDIKIPDAPINPDGTKDSTFAYHYVRQHYFDNINFTDERLLRTNIVDTKVRKYLKDYVPKIPDSIQAGVDFVIGKSRIDSAVFQYVTVMLLNEYASSKVMGFDAVYVYIVDKYYKGGQAFWLDDVELYKIMAQAEKLRPTLIGKQAPQLILQDTAGNDIPLYSLQSKYTVLIFWDVDCGHCKKEMPKIEALYPELKQMGGEVYAAYSQEEWDKWKKWLNEKKYPWVNAGNMKLKSDFQTRYNIDQTPIILILDKNKKIIAKRIAADQIMEFLHHQPEAGG